MLLGWGADAFTQSRERHDMLTRTEIITALQAHKCVVKFTKVTGEVREMPCTLREDLIPKQEVKENAKPKKPNDAVVSVWCLDKQAWRSFRVDSVQELRVDLEMPVVV